MSRAQREKGKRGELQVRDIFNAVGFDCYRTPNSGGLQLPGDIQGVPGLHVECKHQERVLIKDWINQAGSDCPDGSMPVVAWRTSRMPWRVDLDLRDFAAILAELHALRQREHDA